MPFVTPCVNQQTPFSENPWCPKLMPQSRGFHEWLFAVFPSIVPEGRCHALLRLFTLSSYEHGHIPELFKNQ